MRAVGVFVCYTTAKAARATMRQFSIMDSTTKTITSITARITRGISIHTGVTAISLG